MKFYVLEVNGETVGCETSLKAAKLQVTGDDWCITVLEVPVNAETVRLLLANKGGYAETLRTIEP
jgi:hypothetical protein